MEGAVEACHNLSWFDGFMFTLWLGVIYYGKSRIDYHFANKKPRR